MSGPRAVQTRDGSAFVAEDVSALPLLLGRLPLAAEWCCTYCGHVLAGFYARGGHEYALLETCRECGKGEMMRVKP